MLLRLFGKAVEVAFLVVPDEIRLHPRALTAYARRAAGKLPADGPLAEAPVFMAPPRDRRGLPMHYFPPRRTVRTGRRSGAHHVFACRAAPARGRGQAA